MFDDWLVVLSEDEWSRFLHEGEKSIATHRASKNLVQKLGGSEREVSRKGLRMGRTERLIKLKKNYRDSLHSVFKRVHKGSLSEDQALGLLRRVFNHYFKSAYALGLQTQGVGRQKSLKEIVKKFSYDDHYHVRTMIDEEIRHVKQFLRNIKERSLRMPYSKRMLMYVQGLEGVYGGARVAALESSTLLYWTGPMDKKKCPSCQYLVEAGPFLPQTLPATPRDGSTVCLTNCRDKVVARKALDEEVRMVLSGGLSRRQHVANLKKIKEVKALKRGKRRIAPRSPSIPL